MSTYYTALETTTRITRKDMVFNIVKEAATHYKGYGWQDDLLNADSLDNMMNEFNIVPYHTQDSIIPILNDTPGSLLFYDILPKIAPYMADGKISGLNSDGESFRITFKEGKCRINGKLAKGIDYKEYYLA